VGEAAIAAGGGQGKSRPDDEDMASLLAGVLEHFGMTDAVPQMLQELALRAPAQFLAAGVARLKLDEGMLGRRKRSLRLFDVPAFLLELVRSEQLSLGALRDFCANYIREDPLLDVKLARLLPARSSDDCPLDIDAILRLLSVLDEISAGPRLLMVIGHLTHHPDKRVASKAALLVGRRLRNRDWVERHLKSTDNRVRANVVESMWGVNSALAAQTFHRCLLDDNNRVVGNALVGLYLSGNRKIAWRVQRLAQDSRAAFRQTAAWVIATVAGLDMQPLLESLLTDPAPEVRLTAANAWSKLCATGGSGDVGAIHTNAANLDCAASGTSQSASVSMQCKPESDCSSNAAGTGQTSPATDQPSPEAPGDAERHTPERTDSTPVGVDMKVRLDGCYIASE
jgi:hypothetical protein